MPGKTHPDTTKALKYAQKHGVAAAAKKYRLAPSTVYRAMKRAAA